MRNFRKARIVSLALGNKFVRFLIVGGVATIIQYLALIGMVERWHWNAVVASSLGYFLSAIANYLLNYYFTFRSDNQHRVAIARFAAVAAAGFILNALLMELLAEKLHVPYVLAQILATGGTLIWNYWANSRWSFDRRRSQDSGDAHRRAV
ncbi:MAG: GtrA family protein [Pseudomonadota bacterium]|nr:GtrA family protein [Pseudomonadota bacterium]